MRRSSSPTASRSCTSRCTSEDNPLQHVEAFARFQEGIGDRCDEQPVVAQLEEVGSYRFMEEAP